MKTVSTKFDEITANTDRTFQAMKINLFNYGEKTVVVDGLLEMQPGEMLTLGVDDVNSQYLCKHSLTFTGSGTARLVVATHYVK